MTRDVKCDSRVLVAACTKKTSIANTGLKELDAVLAKNGFADALVSVFATYKPYSASEASIANRRK